MNYRCRHCGLGQWVEEREQPSTIRCRRCEHDQSITPHTDADGRLVQCWICGCDRMYRQRDFNRKVGVAIVAVAAVLGPFTKWLSLVVAALIDLALYLKLPEIALCYHCEAIHRGIEFAPAIESYDLATHERYEDKDWGKLHELDAT